MTEFRGNPVSRGYALGYAYLFENPSIIVEEKRIEKAAADSELKIYETARASAEAAVAALCKTAGNAGEDRVEILNAHLAILKDRALDREIRKRIEKAGCGAEYAIAGAFDKFAGMMSALKDERMRERAQDFLDIKQRVLYAVRGIERKDLSNLPENCIIVCHELFPSDTANLDQAHVRAILTETGGETSHSAILARGYGIPAVSGMEGLMEQIQEGTRLAVDAVNGAVLASPDAETEAVFEQKILDCRKRQEVLRRYQGAEPVTKDGRRIEVLLNLGSSDTEELKHEVDVDGVGLFRSEFLYMEKAHMPSEEEQFQAYKKALAAFGEKPLILRTLDIGGDKQLPYLTLPEEQNPFLGQRAVRLCFAQPSIFKMQLRAALRASVYGNLWIMFPMIGGIEDFRKAKQITQETLAELKEEGKPCREDVKLGVMIEIPSLAIMADQIAKEVDFASVGSNDLVQYTLAADRGNEMIASYYQEFHPAVFRLMRFCAAEFSKCQKSLCICGELGGNPLAELVLIGLGFRKLSMGISSVAEAKRLITRLDTARAEQIAAAVCEMETQQQVTAYLEKEYQEICQEGQDDSEENNDR